MIEPGLTLPELRRELAPIQRAAEDSRDAARAASEALRIEAGRQARERDRIGANHQEVVAFHKKRRILGGVFAALGVALAGAGAALASFGARAEEPSPGVGQIGFQTPYIASGITLAGLGAVAVGFGTLGIVRNPRPVDPMARNPDLVHAQRSGQSFSVKLTGMGFVLFSGLLAAVAGGVALVGVRNYARTQGFAADDMTPPPTPETLEKEVARPANVALAIAMLAPAFLSAGVAMLFAKAPERPRQVSLAAAPTLGGVMAGVGGRF